MEQELTLLRERIERILNTELSSLLASSGRGGGGPVSEADYRKAIQSPKLRRKLEDAVSSEIDQFFSKRRSEELFSSAVSLTVPAGPAAKLQRALVEECSQALMKEFDKKTATFKSHLSGVPDAMLNRRWIQRTFDGMFEDISKNSSTLLHGLNLSPVFSEVLPEMLNTIEVSPTALSELKRSLNQEIIFTLNSYAGELPASPQPSSSSGSSSQSRPRRSGSGKLRISMGRGEKDEPENGAEGKLRIPESLGDALDLSVIGKIADDVTSELSAYLEAQLEVMKSSTSTSRTYEREKPKSSPTIMPEPVARDVEPSDTTSISDPATYTPPLRKERFLDPAPLHEEVLASATPERPFLSAGTPGVAKTLVIHCSDPRVQETTRKLLQHQFALAEGEYAKIVIPGAVQTLTLDDYLPKFSWATRKWIDFIHELINFERVICISHDDCRWYQERRFIPFRAGGMKLTEEERQHRDLKLSAEILREMMPRAEIDLFHLSPNVGESARLERVKLDQFSSST